jgi:hypothetical protein
VVESVKQTEQWCPDRFIVEISTVVESIKQTEQWCPDRKIRCPDGLGRELPVSLCVRTSCRHTWQGLSFFWGVRTSH